MAAFLDHLDSRGACTNDCNPLADEINTFLRPFLDSIVPRSKLRISGQVKMQDDLQLYDGVGP